MLRSAPLLGYSKSLDGLRAIAVMLVLLTHANFQLGDNGILGVDIFFTLSGFLITTLLLEEFERDGDISMKGFYIRRTMRLFPALYTMLVFVLLYVLFFRSGEDRASILGELISSALYLNNVSWTWGWGNEGLLLGHTWSLAVEEQFYLIWPWIVIAALYFKQLRLLAVLVAVFVCTILVFKITGVMTEFGKSLFHEAIFIGCLAALIRRLSGYELIIPEVIIIALTVFVIVVGVFPIDWYMELYKSGGRSFIAVITAIIIGGIVANPNGSTARVLSYSPMVFVGKISYALYLWHLPVFRLFAYHSTLPPAVSFILKFVVSFALATLSWLLIEKKATEFGRSISKRLSNKKSFVTGGL